MHTFQSDYDRFTMKAITVRDPITLILIHPYRLATKRSHNNNLDKHSTHPGHDHSWLEDGNPESHLDRQHVFQVLQLV